VTFFGRGVLAIALLSATVVVAAASRRGQSQQPPAEYTIKATIKDLMDAIIDPSAEELC